MNVEVHRIHLERAVRGESSGGREVRRRLRQAARVERVALDVTGFTIRGGRVERADWLPRAVNDSAREVETTAAGLHGLTDFGFRHPEIVILHHEGAECENRCIDLHRCGGAEVHDFVGDRPDCLHWRQQHVVRHDDVGSGNDAEIILAQRHIARVGDIVTDGDRVRGDERQVSVDLSAHDHLSVHEHDALKVGIELVTDRPEIGSVGATGCNDERIRSARSGEPLAVRVARIEHIAKASHVIQVRITTQEAASRGIGELERASIFVVDLTQQCELAS